MYISFVNLAITLNIPPQPPRRVVLRNLLSTGMAVVEGVDGLKPAQYEVHGSDFPWADYLPLVYRAWRHNQKVPEPFKPLRRIPEPIFDQLIQIPLSEQMQVLKALRKGGFLPRVREEANVA